MVQIITRLKPSFASLSSLEGRRRRDGRVPVLSLAFKSLLDSNNDQSLLWIMHLFRVLLSLSACL